MRLCKWGQALFLFVFVLGIAARAEAARLRLSVPVHGVSHVAFYAAKEKGYFQEEGLDVEVILTSGASVFERSSPAMSMRARLADPPSRRSSEALPCEWFSSVSINRPTGFMQSPTSAP
jgi:hypothetical protein